MVYLELWQREPDLQWGGAKHLERDDLAVTNVGEARRHDGDLMT